ncbi:MAG: efflux RND transporter periplasmic adaptor subunit [Chloroflexota bacterium]|nr:efflux RND transporter periplasmic adaptor subunit [Chloroflexota bacterium]
MNRSLLYGMGIGVVLMAAVVVLLGGALTGPRPSPSPTARPSITPRPSTATIRPSPTPIDTSIEATAVVIPQRSADLSVPIDGIVDQIYVHELDQVTVGQLILRLDQTTYLAGVGKAQSDLEHFDAVLAKAQLEVDQLPADATPAQIASAQADLRLAQTDRDVAASTLTEAQVALRQTELRAPFAGTVAAINIERGEQAVAGQPVAAIGDLSSWLIETTDLSELEVVRVAVGDVASVTFEALPDLVLNGHVDRIEVRGTGAAGNVVFAVSIKPDTHNEQLRWNMTATVRITPSD